MAVFPKLRDAFRRTATDDDAVTPVAVSMVEDNEKGPVTDDTAASNGSDEPQAELPSEDAQRGVKEVEAVTLTWSKKTLIAVFLKYVFVLAADRVYPANSIPLQYLAALFRQCIPILDSLQLAPLCHERVRIPLAVERHLHCRECHVRCNVHPSVENHGRLGSR